MRCNTSYQRTFLPFGFSYLKLWAGNSSSAFFIVAHSSCPPCSIERLGRFFNGIFTYVNTVTFRNEGPLPSLLCWTSSSFVMRLLCNAGFYDNDRCICSIFASLIGEYSCLKAEFHLQRSMGYHLVQSYLPTVLIVVISWVSFWLDVEAIPARITLGVTTLLTISSKVSVITKW